MLYAVVFYKSVGRFIILGKHQFIAEKYSKKYFGFSKMDKKNVQK